MVAHRELARSTAIHPLLPPTKADQLSPSLRRWVSCSQLRYRHRPSRSLDSSTKMLQSLQARRINKPDAKVLRLPDIQTSYRDNMFLQVQADTHHDTSCGPTSAVTMSTMSDASENASSALPTPISIQSSDTGYSPFVPRDGECIPSFHSKIDDTQHDDRTDASKLHREEGGDALAPSTANTHTGDHAVMGYMFPFGENQQPECTDDDQQRLHCVVAGDSSSTDSPVSLTDVAPSHQEANSVPTSSAEDAEAERKRYLKRVHALREFETTEENYVEDLDSLVNVFVRVLAQCNWFPEALHRRLEGTMLEMLRVQQQFLAMIALPSSMKGSECSNQPSVTTHYIQHLYTSFSELSHSCHLYGGFCDVREKTLRQISRVANSSMYISFQNKCKEQFLIRHEERNAARATSGAIPRLSDIKDFLIKPIQRVCRYPLLVQELIRLTKETDAEHEDLTQMLVIAKAMAAHVDEAQKLYERRQKTEKLIEYVPEATTPRKASNYAPLHLHHHNFNHHHHRHTFYERDSVSFILAASTGSKSIREQRRSSTGNAPVHRRVGSSGGMVSSGAMATVTTHCVANSNNNGSNYCHERGAMVVSSIMMTESTMASKACSPTTPTLLAPSEVVYPSGLTRPYLKTLGPLLMLNVLEVYHLNNLPVRSKIYGCVLFDTMLVMISPKKASSYEPRHWLPLRLLEIGEVDPAVEELVGDATIAHYLEDRRDLCWQLTFGDHIFLLSALDTEEKAVWVTVLRTQIEAAKRNAEHLRTLASNRDSNTASVAVLSQIYQGIHEKTVSSLPWNTPGSFKPMTLQGSNSCSCNTCSSNSNNSSSPGLGVAKAGKGISKGNGGNSGACVASSQGISARFGTSPLSYSQTIASSVYSSSMDAPPNQPSSWNLLAGGTSRATSRLSTVTMASVVESVASTLDNDEEEEEESVREYDKGEHPLEGGMEAISIQQKRLSQLSTDDRLPHCDETRLSASHVSAHGRTLSSENQRYLSVCTDITMSSTSGSDRLCSASSSKTVEHGSKGKQTSHTTVTAVGTGSSSQEARRYTTCNSVSTPVLQGSSSLTSLRPGSPLPRIFSDRRPRSNSDVVGRSSGGGNSTHTAGHSGGGLWTNSREGKITAVRNLLKEVSTQCTWDIPASLSAASSPSLSRSSSQSNHFLTSSVGVSGNGGGHAVTHTPPGVSSNGFATPLMSPLTTLQHTTGSNLEYGSEDGEEITPSPHTQHSHSQNYHTFTASSLTNRFLRRRDSAGKGSIMSRGFFSTHSSFTAHHPHHQHSACHQPQSLHHQSSHENQRDHRLAMSRSGSDSNMGPFSSPLPTSRRPSATAALAATLNLKKLVQGSSSSINLTQSAAVTVNSEETSIKRRSSHCESSASSGSEGIAKTSASTSSSMGHTAGKRSVSFHEQSSVSSLSSSSISEQASTTVATATDASKTAAQAPIAAMTESTPATATELPGFSQDTIESLQSAAIMARTRRTTSSSDAAASVSRTRESSVSSLMAPGVGPGNCSQPGTPRVLAANTMSMLSSPPMMVNYNNTAWDPSVPVHVTSPKAVARSWHAESGLAALQNQMGQSHPSPLCFQPIPEIQPPPLPQQQHHRESGIERMWHAMGRTFGGGGRLGSSGSIAGGGTPAPVTFGGALISHPIMLVSTDVFAGGTTIGVNKQMLPKKRLSAVLGFNQSNDSQPSSMHSTAGSGIIASSEFQQPQNDEGGRGMGLNKVANTAAGQLYQEYKPLPPIPLPMLGMNEESSGQHSHDTQPSLEVVNQQPSGPTKMHRRTGTADPEAKDTYPHQLVDSNSRPRMRELSRDWSLRRAGSHAPVPLAPGQKGKGKRDSWAAQALSMATPTTLMANTNLNTGPQTILPASAPVVSPAKQKSRSIFNTAFKTLISGGGSVKKTKQYPPQHSPLAYSPGSSIAVMPMADGNHSTTSHFVGREVIHGPGAMVDGFEQTIPASSPFAPAEAPLVSTLTEEVHEVVEDVEVVIVEEEEDEVVEEEIVIQHASEAVDPFGPGNTAIVIEEVVVDVKSQTVEQPRDEAEKPTDDGGVETGGEALSAEVEGFTEPVVEQTATRMA
ncbi:T-lymphoma invasion and metastasis-inducing protein 2 [Actinomortierella ambigua]|nr:T-lymphoma invasion and metastasis-inducing protein 2 [Actinomortierella ambigua]